VKGIVWPGLLAAPGKTIRLVDAAEPNNLTSHFASVDSEFAWAQGPEGAQREQGARAIPVRKARPVRL
jgi:hypothetical protein